MSLAVFDVPLPSSPESTQDPSASATPVAKSRWRPRRASLAAAIVGVFALVVALGAITPHPVGPVVDDAMYVILARSLATGQGYRSLNLPGLPPNTHFPPGYPAVLSLLWRVAPDFPANLVVFKLFNAVCLAVAAAAAVRYLQRRGVGLSWAVGLGVASAISVPLLTLGVVLLSEPLFIALVLLLLPSLEQYVGDADAATGAARASIRRALILGALIAACTLVRTHGIALVPALFVSLALRRRWRDAALVSASAIACLLPWQLWCAAHRDAVPPPLLGEYASYTSWWMRGLGTVGWRFVPQTVFRTSAETSAMFGSLFSPLGTTTAHAVTFLALAGLLFACVTTSWRRIPVTLLFLAGYLAIVCAWPFQPARFVWGVWPLLLAIPTLALSTAINEQPAWSRLRRGAIAAAFAWVSVGYLAYELRAVRGQWWASIPRSKSRQIVFAVDWARRNSRPTDVLATDEEGPVYLYTGRQTVPVRAFTATQYLHGDDAQTAAAEGLLAVLAAYPVQAVIVNSAATYDIARYLASGASAVLAPHTIAPAGEAYLVLRR